MPKAKTLFLSFDALKSHFTVDSAPSTQATGQSMPYFQAQKKRHYPAAFFQFRLASALFGFRLCCQSLDQVHQLATHLGIADLDECAIELKALRGRQEVDHVVRA